MVFVIKGVAEPVDSIQLLPEQLHADCSNRRRLVSAFCWTFLASKACRHKLAESPVQKHAWIADVHASYLHACSCGSQTHLE